MKKCVIIGGGAAGYFTAIKSSEENPDFEVFILEQTQKVLSKVKISGGGRCNVTHNCFDPSILVQNYPRGAKELRGPFSHFQPKDTVEWFEKRGVELKAEEDGRMFPVTDSSQTIIECLCSEANRLGVFLNLGAKVANIQKKGQGFEVQLKKGEVIYADKLVISTGSAPMGHALIKGLGHTIEAPVPSLFTFNIPDSPLLDLSGVSLKNVAVSLPEFRKNQTGPLLITHWGFSGPAVLKLSAFCARELRDCNYVTVCDVDWIPDISILKLKEWICEKKEISGQKKLLNDPINLIPKQLWKALLIENGFNEKSKWINFSNSNIEKLIQKLKKDRYKINGKTTYKQEFVTCGGVKLSEVNFKTMESKLVSNLYFAGEVLNIDGITGGFNFQAAWTTGWLAGLGISLQK